MTQLFLRFYLGILAVLFLAWFIYGYVLQARYEADRARVVTRAHASGLRLVVDALRPLKSSERSAALVELRKDFRCPLEIREQKELQSDDRRRLQSQGGSSYLRWNRESEGVGIAIDEESYVRMGPFPNYELPAIEDSMRGWIVTAIKQLNQSETELPIAIDRLQERFDLGVALQSIEELPLAASDRMQGGRDVVFYPLAPNQWFASGALSGHGKLIRFGPFPNFSREERPAATTTLALVLLPAALAIALLLRPVARQLRQIESAATSIASGDLHARVDESRTGSARYLARAFNQMAARTETMLRTQRELLQAVSHELKTPLARMRFAMDLAASATEDSQRRKRLDAMDDAIEDLDALVDELIDYVRMENAGSPKDRERLDVNEILESLVTKYQALYPDVGFQMEFHRNGLGETFEANRTAFHRAIGNLISNAGRFASHRVIVRTHSKDRSTIIEIEDDGPGIPESDRVRVFEPFVRLDSRESSTGRSSGAGVGLGLAIVRRIMEQHCGTVELLSSPSGGCLARTTWPIDGSHETIES